MGEAVGKELRAVGVNWNIAPVMDSISDLVEPLEVSRRFGWEPETIGDYTTAFCQGLHDAGVTMCATEALTMSLQEAYRRTLNDRAHIDEDFLSLIQDELQPLRKLQAEGLLDCLMLSSCMLEFDDAERSQRSTKFVIDDVVRRYMRYDGPIIVSCAELPLGSSICLIHAPLRALLMGSDMVCLPTDHNDQLTSMSAIHAAIEADAILRSAVAKSHDRVTALKSRCMSWPMASSSSSADLDPALLATHSTVAQAAYRASIACLQPDPSPLISLEPGSVVLLLTPTVPLLGARAEQSDPFEPLGRALSHYQPRVRHVPYTLSAGLTPTHLAFLTRVAAVILVLACTSSALEEVQSELCTNVTNVVADIEQRSAGKIAKLILSAADVRDLSQTDVQGKGWWGIVCWDYTKGALEAAADVICGRREATGRIPARVMNTMR